MNKISYRKQLNGILEYIKEYHVFMDTKIVLVFCYNKQIGWLPLGLKNFRIKEVK